MGGTLVQLIFGPGRAIRWGNGARRDWPRLSLVLLSLILTPSLRMKIALRRFLRLAVWLCLWVVGAAPAFGEGYANAHRFLKQVEKEAPELFFIPLSGVDPRNPEKVARRKLAPGDEWLMAVAELVKDRDIDFRFEPMMLDDVAEAKSYPKAFCWRRGEKSGVVLRRFQDAKAQWITPWDSGENWMMIVFELMNLEGISQTERYYDRESELIEGFARSEYRAMQRTNDVFHQTWVPYCEKIGARVEMSRIPWFNRNVAMGEEAWGKQAVESPEFKAYREWILVSGMHRLRKPEPTVPAPVMEVE